MPHLLYLVPGGNAVGLTSVALGVVHALDSRGVRVAFYKPIGQAVGQDSGPERSTYFVRRTSSLTPATPIPLEEAERLIALGRSDQLFEAVLRGLQESIADADVVIVEGLVDGRETSGEGELNRELVSTLSAEVIVVGSLASGSVSDLEARLEWTASRFGGFGPGRVVGTIINHVPRDAPPLFVLRPELNLLGAIPQNPELMAYRTVDLARYLGAKVLHEGEMNQRRVSQIRLLARTVSNLVGALQAGSVLITPGDRVDVLVLIALAAANKIPISGVILTGDLEIPERIMELCRPAFETGLPLLQVPDNSWETTTNLARMSHEIPIDDLDRARRAMEFVANHVDVAWIAGHSQVPLEARASPAAFCFRLTERARAEQADRAARGQRTAHLARRRDLRRTRHRALCIARRAGRSKTRGRGPRHRAPRGARDLGSEHGARELRGAARRATETQGAHGAQCARAARRQRLARHDDARTRRGRRLGVRRRALDREYDSPRAAGDQD
jgi:phosphate acetyltransferase